MVPDNADGAGFRASFGPISGADVRLAEASSRVRVVRGKELPFALAVSFSLINRAASAVATIRRVPLRIESRHVSAEPLEVVVAALLSNDWELSVAPGVNTWLIGCDEETDAVLDLLRPYLQAPIITALVGDALILPSALEPVRTLILRGVDSFTLGDQQRLHAWLDVTVGVRVVSTSPQSMMPAIEAGGFIESLYYRLNTVVMECRSGDEVAFASKPTMCGSEQRSGQLCRSV